MKENLTSFSENPKDSTKKALLHKSPPVDEPFFFSFQDFYNRNFYIGGGWSLDYYWTVRGAENFHIYLWIAKDFAWAQDLYWPAMVFGSSAVAWCLLLAYYALTYGGLEEFYMLLATILWLSGNFVWMAGEVFYNDDDYVVPRVAVMFETAISWILFFHVVLRPLKLVKKEYNDESMYRRHGLHPRFSYFRDWREYEHAHTLCWLGKDLSWNRLSPIPWVICLFFTISIAADFIWVTFKTKRMMEDCVHYLAQLMWVVGNMMWALGNIFVNYNDDDNATGLFFVTPAATVHMRWFASWVLFAAYWPIIILYIVWIPMTLMGKFPESARDSMMEVSPEEMEAAKSSTTMELANSHNNDERVKKDAMYAVTHSQNK